MRKHLIGTILVLAALAACNKEVETPAPAVDNGQEEVTPGKVTLTFKAAIDEETRTTYANDKTASWAAGDKISVCLTDSESYDVVDFTTEDGVTFTGEVNPGYTTPVSAIYPANEVYTTYSWNSYFSQDDGSVTAVRLADGYELGSDDDPGKFIPLIGSYDGETMTFHHFCNTLKVTLTNIPEDAAYFTFATNKQKLVSDFSLTGGRMGLVSQEDDTDTRVYFEFEPGSLTTRSFYIPVPDGTLAANSYVALQDGGGADLFKKRITSSPTFGLNTKNKDAIRVLPEVACWTKKDDWKFEYLYDDINSTNGNINSVFVVSGTSPHKYQYYLYPKSSFKYDSVADYFVSSAFDSNRSSRTTYNDDPRIVRYVQRKTPGDYLFVIYGVDDSKNFTGEYNTVDIAVPAFTTPEGWSISVDENDEDGIRVNVSVPEGRVWQYASLTKEEYETAYKSDLPVFIWSKRTDQTDLNTGTSYSYLQQSTGDYILIAYGMNEREEGGNRTPTFEYCMLEYSFEVPTEAYNTWLGKWKVFDGDNTDTWTISRKQANHSYIVTGLCKRSFAVIEAAFSDDGSIQIDSQRRIGTTTYETGGNTYTVTLNLYGKKTANGNAANGIYPLLKATLDDSDNTIGILSPAGETYLFYTLYGSYINNDNETKGLGYGTRSASATMTKTE